LPGNSQAPLVFLHEGLGSVAMWRDWPADLCAATGRPGVVISRRGYGQSDPVPRGTRRGRLPPDYLHREAWEVLPALLEHLGITQPVLLGHSDGASIALLYASRFPVRACIAMAPHVMVEAVSLRSIAAARDAFVDGDLRQRLARHHADVDGAFWQWNDAWLNPAFRSFDIRADCRRITAPVLAIQGSGRSLRHDGADRPDRPPRTRRSGAWRCLQCGHSPHRDAPDATLAAIVDFLATIG
jgi:pimeloyl-ACP methyl ester carboxylesterase